MTSTLVLLSPLTGSELKRLTDIFSDQARIVVVRNKKDLEATEFDGETTLLSFGTGVIVSEGILAKLTKPAYNLHAASPDFPGRDPHHHAVYHSAKSYGATLHVMAAKVDSGPIVAVETFVVGQSDTPAELLEQSNEAGMAILIRLGARLLDSKPLPELDDVHWGRVKTTRADLTHLSKITPLIDEEEFARRYRSFDGGAYDNLALKLHDRTFRIDKRTPLPSRNGSSFLDFTEVSYRRILQQLKNGGYRFTYYSEGREDRHVIWRHDVDFSMHRAVRLAEIEAE